MSPKQEPKYFVNDDGVLANRATGKEIPRDEPVLILVGSNPNAANTIRYYLQRLRNEAHARVVDGRLDEFVNYAGEVGKAKMITNMVDQEVLDFVEENEPALIMRGQDCHTVATAAFYLDQLPKGSPEASAVSRLLSAFQKFAAESPERLKEPDTCVVVDKVEQPLAADETATAAPFVPLPPSE